MKREIKVIVFPVISVISHCEVKLNISYREILLLFCWKIFKISFFIWILILIPTWVYCCRPAWSRRWNVWIGCIRHYSNSCWNLLKGIVKPVEIIKVSWLKFNNFVELSIVWISIENLIKVEFILKRHLNSVDPKILIHLKIEFTVETHSKEIGVPLKNPNVLGLVVVRNYPHSHVGRIPLSIVESWVLPIMWKNELMEVRLIIHVKDEPNISIIRIIVILLIIPNKESLVSHFLHAEGRVIIEAVMIVIKFK